MSLTAAQSSFRRQLAREHLEEASFLYAWRAVAGSDDELPWADLEEFEERFEAHIDALVVGADPALEVCKQQCASGDVGELHAALRVFCRQDRPDLAYAVLQNIDPADGEVVQAVVDALKSECPQRWHDDLQRFMLGRCTEVIPVLAEALAYQRVPAEETLLRAVPACAEDGLQRVAWALGRVGTERAHATLTQCLRSENVVVAEAACRALIRLGDYHAIRHGLLVAQMKPWPVLSLGIGGNHAAVNVLTDLVKSDKVSDEALLALGLLGDLASVGAIFDCLSNPERAAAAAVALQTVTGAQLRAEVFVPDEIDPDELFDDERERYEQTGEVPTRPDGEPFGESVTQISIDPETWRAWLTAHRAQFDPKLRYRHGKPLGPAALFEALAAEHTPNLVRALICDELVVRYGANVSLEADMPVREQRAHLTELARWVSANAHRFEAGVWYFAGQPMARA